MPSTRRTTPAAALAERQRALGVRLPAALVECFSSPLAVAMLGATNADRPCRIGDLGGPMPTGWKGARAGPERLVFMIENQSVCVWAVRLDGSDDPPVEVALASGTRWRPCALSFSTFFACRVWEADLLASDAAVQAQAAPASPRDLVFLRRHFCERERTRGWPADRQLRFERNGARILLWLGPRQTDWWIAGEDEGALEAALRTLWPRSDLRTSLWSHTELGDAVLLRIRRTPSPA